MDATHKEMVGDLLRMGYSVADTSGCGNDFPDLVIGKHGITRMLEVKTPYARASGFVYRSSEGQIKFADEWKGSAIITHHRAEDVNKRFMHDARILQGWTGRKG
jgi:Holliday junction resolvase